MAMLAGYGGDMTLPYCRMLASSWGFAYYAVQFGGACFGSNDLERAARLGPSSSCNMGCTGRPSDLEECGGAWANSIYLTAAREQGAARVRACICR